MVSPPALVRVVIISFSLHFSISLVIRLVTHAPVRTCVFIRHVMHVMGLSGPSISLLSSDSVHGLFNLVCPRSGLSPSWISSQSAALVRDVTLCGTLHVHATSRTGSTNRMVRFVSPPKPKYNERFTRQTLSMMFG